jgi:arylsulfatase A-like enzyme
VPILIKWPKEMGRGPALKDASHLDIVPTVLDVAGFPETAWQGMPGRSLYRKKEATSILNTCYAGQNGETMLWRRDGWEAAFSWSKTWELRPPDRMWLERIQGPNGPVDCKDPAAYEAELRRIFPDAFSRVFNSCERETD